MALGLLERFFIKFRRFSSADAPNPELRGLTVQEARCRADRKMVELLEAYIRGEISGHQCRVFLNDFVRDSIALGDEVEYRKRHQENLEVATLDRHGPVEESEAEHTLSMIVRAVRNGELTFEAGRNRLTRLVRTFPTARQNEWSTMFRELCGSVRG